MTESPARTTLLRSRRSHEYGRVTFIELFFDLVFVFAVTQLSHSLLKHLTFDGAVHTALLFVAIWWAWIATSWVTNWLDPERAPVRLLLLVLMLAGLILSTSIADAFETKALTFALALVTIEVGRSLFVLWAFGSDNHRNTLNFQRIVFWQTLCGIFWIAGACLEGDQRLALWAVAAVLTWAAPALGFPVPGLGYSTSEDWDIDGGHLAERCSLFIIIALGESILVTGATFSEHDWTAPSAAAFVIAFIGSVAMWWIYFDTGAERGSRKIAASADPGRLARLAYTYFHGLIVAGIIVAAVADERVLAHPEGHLDFSVIAVILGGPALYLVGNTLFKWAIAGRMPLSHLVGLGLLVGTGLAAPYATLLSLSAATTAILVVVAGWETVSLKGKPRKPAEIEG
ncbi:MAG TPA: low temperature requirement protein A [Parvibaculum sp.]|jgi:low temperature requirement protein LtrA